MSYDLRQRSRLRRVDEIFRRFLAAARAKLTIADNELLQRAEQAAQGGEHAGRSADEPS